MQNQDTGLIATVREMRDELWSLDDADGKARTDFGKEFALIVVVMVCAVALMAALGRLLGY